MTSGDTTEQISRPQILGTEKVGSSFKVRQLLGRPTIFGRYEARSRTQHQLPKQGNHTAGGSSTGSRHPTSHRGDTRAQMPQAKSAEGVPSPGPAASSQVGPAPNGAVMTDAQLHALLDILTHHQTYAEIERFKDPATIAGHGYPFGTKAEDGELSHSAVSSAPLIASLFRPVVLPMPGVRDLPTEFWSGRVQSILVSLGDADLSESYDKGALGTRKTLATAAAVVLESVSRGCLGGVPRGETRDLDGAYDSSKAEEVVRAWDDLVHELVYGSLVDDLFDCAAEKGDLEEHSAAVRLVVDYIIIHLATFMHHIFVLSPEGPYLIKLAESAHRMVPYAMVKQTLRVGNAATMINGLLKIFLAKMSVGAMSNWLGLTENADDGMNLLQRIISIVLSWDSSDFRKSAEKVEKAKDGPSKVHLAALKEFTKQPREEHAAVRQDSIERKISIVAAIFEHTDPTLLSSLSEAQHTQCLEYYSAMLSVRDRDALTTALCAQNPDNFTRAIREATASFEPIIRAIHDRVDLRELVTFMESFLNDLIATSKTKQAAASYSLWRKADTKAGPAPSVEDYVGLLRKNRHFLYDWLHQVASKCPETADEFRVWAKDTIKMFQANGPKPSSAVPPKPPTGTPGEKENGSEDASRRPGAAGVMSGKLQAILADLPGETQVAILGALDAHANYLSTLGTLSTTRIQKVLDNLAAAEESKDSSAPAQVASMSGPGMFLSRWQALLDETAITPGPAGGSLRSGKDVKGSTAMGKTGAVPLKDTWDAAALAALGEKDVPQPPDVHVVVESLSPGFEELLVELTRG